MIVGRSGDEVEEKARLQVIHGKNYGVN